MGTSFAPVWTGTMPATLTHGCITNNSDVQVPYTDLPAAQDSLLMHIQNACTMHQRGAAHLHMAMLTSE